MQAQNAMGFSGAVLVAKKGEIIFEKALGKANIEWDINNTTATKFRIGSITKQFTAASIMKLVEEGKLSVYDKLSKYIADYPKGDSVTIQMLLNHTSGIANYTDFDEYWTHLAYLPVSPDSFIRVFKNKPYYFSPGSKFSYNNSGYFLLGMIIEKVSGEKYNDYLFKNIILPAGLKNTNIDDPEMILTNRAMGYVKKGDHYCNAAYISMDGPWSAGAIYSTVKDLYNWHRAFWAGKIVSLSSVEQMTTIYKGNYGYGFFIDSFNHDKRVWHEGGIPGFTSMLSYYLYNDVCIVILSNNSFNTVRMEKALAKILIHD